MKKLNISKSTISAILLIAALGAAPAYAAEGSAEAGANNTEAAAMRALADAWLDGRLEGALLFNEHLNPLSIDSQVRNGVVVLSGSVESEIDKELAQEIALSIDGIESVVNDLVVDKTKANHQTDASKERMAFKQHVADATITAKVKSELLLSDNTSGLAINVDTQDGVVTLRGKVESEKARELAVTLAKNVEGAKSVESELAVKG